MTAFDKNFKIPFEVQWDIDLKEKVKIEVMHFKIAEYIYHISIASAGFYFISS